MTSNGGERHAETIGRRPSGTIPPVVLLGLGLLLLVPAPSADARNEELAAAVRNAKRATVGILEPDRSEPTRPTRAHFTVRGTGVHVREGYIVTARHAVERQVGGRTVISEHIRVLTEDFHELPATLTGFNAFLDVAVYRVTAEAAASLPAAAPFGEREPGPGEEVFTVGYPLGWGPTIGFGRVGNPDTFLATVQSRLVQIDLAACSGNSGGGVFNAQGEVVGVVHAIIQTGSLRDERRCSRLAFAVPGALARRLVDALIAGADPAFPRLGVQMTAVKMGTQWRVVLSGVTGPAKQGGLQEGDVLLSVDGTDITSAAQLKSYLLEETRPGQRVEIRVRRADAERVLLVTLGKS